MVEKPKQNITNHISIFDLNTIVHSFLNCANVIIFNFVLCKSNNK